VEKIGYIEIHIDGTRGSLDLTPNQYDIREIIGILENAENLLFPGEKKDRPVISYSIESGSVKHILKTSIQYIIGFNAVLGQVGSQNSIDFLDINTARAIENIQEIAKKKDYNFTISTSVDNSNEIKIDKTTRFYRTESMWVEAEFYFYGKVTNAGGKEKANIHLLTEEYGTIRIDTPIPFLERQDENMLYKNYGIRAIGKQHSETGEIDRSSLVFSGLVDYQPKYDERYLADLRNKARKSWIGRIDPDDWINQMREGYDA
jgi:hypothetical protein